MTSADDEIRMLKDAMRLLDGGVEHTLLGRGWAVANRDAATDEDLEWFWPPMAPLPWTSPTRITRDGTGWLVTFGEASAQRPGEPEHFSTDEALLAELERIEWWPMSVAEARSLSNGRVLELVHAAAHDLHVRACEVTEPYLTQLRTPQPHGDESAQRMLIQGAAWASAERTRRAGDAG